MKCKNSNYYKGSVLWDSLSPEIKRCETLLEFKKGLKAVY